MESASGKRYRASGFKIHLPNVNRTAVVTSGHCTYIEGAYATKISVTFPGQGAIEVEQNDLYASPEYISTGDKDHDYGLILLPGNSDGDGFGWSSQQKTVWITGGAIERYTANRIYYMNDTMSGESGSPVYTWYGGYWTVIAVHSYRGCPNSGPRFTSQMISRFLEQMNGLKAKSLRSVEFSDFYLRCDGTGVIQYEESGGGTVNCQYKPPSLLESFYIYPVEMSPSLAQQTIYKVVIESAQFRQVFIRMDSQGMSLCTDSGGGEVNCQFSTSSWESYFLRQEANDSCSFRSFLTALFA